MKRRANDGKPHPEIPLGRCFKQQMPSSGDWKKCGESICLDYSANQTREVNNFGLRTKILARRLTSV